MIILETNKLILKTIEKENSSILYDLIFSQEDLINQNLNCNAFSMEKMKKFIYQNFCKNNAIIGLAPLFEKTTGSIVGIAGVLEKQEADQNWYEFISIIAQEYKTTDYEQEISQSELIFLKKRLKQKYAFSSCSSHNKQKKDMFEALGMKLDTQKTATTQGEREVYSIKL